MNDPHCTGVSTVLLLLTTLPLQQIVLCQEGNPEVADVRAGFWAAVAGRSHSLLQAPTAAEHSSTWGGSVPRSRDDLQTCILARNLSGKKRFFASLFKFFCCPAETLAQHATTKDDC